MQSERNQRSNIKMHNFFWWWYCWCCSRTCCCCCTCSCGWFTCWLFVYTKKTHTKTTNRKNTITTPSTDRYRALSANVKKIKTTIRSQNGSEYTHTPIFISVIPADICCNFFCSVKSKTTIRIQEYVHVRIRCDWVCVCVFLSIDVGSWVENALHLRVGP